MREYTGFLRISTDLLKKRTNRFLYDTKGMILKRSPSNFGNYAETVQGIVDDVRDNGDAALFSYTKKFDKADITAANVKVTQAEIDYAYTQVSPELLEVIRKAKKNIWEYHEKQKQYSWFDSKPNGTLLGQKVTALASGGVKVPGGKAG